MQQLMILYIQMIAYPAKIRYSSEHSIYMVRFPDLSGCMAEERTLERAVHQGRLVLTAHLSELLEEGHEVPVPSKLKGKDIHMVEPAMEVALPIYLRHLRLKHKLTQCDLARLLGISYQSYQRLERPGRSNPTIKTLERIAQCFKKRLDLNFR